MTIGTCARPRPLESIADRLQEARARTFLLVAPAQRRRAARPARSADEPDPLGPGAHRAFRGALAHPQPRRPDRVRRDAGAVQPVRASAEHARRAAAPGLDRCREIMDEIRGRVLARLAHTDPDDANPLLRDGYVYHMVLQHEYQHNETILQTLQLKHGRPYAPLERRCDCLRRRPCDPSGEMVRFPGGAVEIGTDDRSAAYDNERPRHVVERAAVLHRRASGHQRRLSPLHRGRRLLRAGVLVRRRAGAGWRSPARWRRSTGTASGGRWMTRVMDRSGPVRPDHPVCHVS